MKQQHVYIIVDKSPSMRDYGLVDHACARAATGTWFREPSCCTRGCDLSFGGDARRSGSGL